MRFAAVMVMAGVVVCGPSAASAQTDESRFMLSLNGAFEPGSETYADTGSFTLYDELGTLSVGGRSSTGAILDMGVGVRVTRNFTFGVSAHRGASSDEATVGGAAPHPLFFNRPRTFSATVPETKRIEQALHFSAGVLVPLGEKLDVHIYAGPSQFRFSQQVVGDVVIRENAANTAIEVTPTIVARKRNSWGGHIGADISYPVLEVDAATFRLGGFIRYAQASSEFQMVNNTISTKIGGVQFGGGLRVRF